MSPRRARRMDPSLGKGGRPVRPVEDALRGSERLESAPDGDWKVRQVSGAASDKLYRCPGCENQIRPGLPHVVSWPAWQGGESERRHWHTACWHKRIDRGPGRSRY